MSTFGGGYRIDSFLDIMGLQTYVVPANKMGIISQVTGSGVTINGVSVPTGLYAGGIYVGPGVGIFVPSGIYVFGVLFTN